MIFTIEPQYLPCLSLWDKAAVCFMFHADLIQSWWISIWTRSYSRESELSYISQALPYCQIRLPKTTGFNFQIQQNKDLAFYLGIYVGTSILICILGTLRYLFVVLGALRASRILFEKLTYSILRAPLRWLDTVPVGRILNRFT